MEGSHKDNKKDNRKTDNFCPAVEWSYSPGWDDSKILYLNDENMYLGSYLLSSKIT